MTIWGLSLLVDKWCLFGFESLRICTLILYSQLQLRWIQVLWRTMLTVNLRLFHWIFNSNCSIVWCCNLTTILNGCSMLICIFRGWNTRLNMQHMLFPSNVIFQSCSLCSHTFLQEILGHVHRSEFLWTWRLRILFWVEDLGISFLWVLVCCWCFERHTWFCIYLRSCMLG